LCHYLRALLLWHLHECPFFQFQCPTTLLSTFWKFFRLPSDYPPSLAVPSRSLAYALLCCAFLLVGHAAFLLLSLIYSLYFFNFSHSFPLTTPCPLSSATWWPFFPQSLHVKYETTTSPLLYPNSHRSASLGTPSPQCSNALCLRVFFELLLYSSCCTFCGFTTHAAFSLANLLLGQSLY